jgi:predicted ribosomally synthesized peptide with nif11-like leader
MSEDQLKAFLEAVKTDPALQEQLKAAKDADGVATIAKEAGFAISVEEFVEELSKVQELSDEELEDVAGGTWIPITVITVTIGIVTRARNCVE